MLPGLDPVQKWPHPLGTLSPHRGSSDPCRTESCVKWPSAAGLVPAGLSAVAEIGQECREISSLSKRSDPPGSLGRRSHVLLPGCWALSSDPDAEQTVFGSRRARLGRKDTSRHAARFEAGCSRVLTSK